jgi:hypothetical protein
MRRKQRWTALALTLAGYLSSEGIARATPRDGIVAIVSNQPILASDLVAIAKRWRARWRAMGVTDGYTEEQLLQAALDGRITQTLLVAEARRLELGITPGAIDEELAARAKVEGITVAAFVARSGNSEAVTRDAVYEQLLRRTLLRHAYPYHRVWNERHVQVTSIGLPPLGKPDPSANNPSDFDRLFEVYVEDLKRRGTITIEVKSWR